MLTFCFSGYPPVQNTYTNADKLLEAAEQLAQTGECDPEEIYQAAHQLEDRIQDFVRRVEQRKILLDMSVSFHTHVKEVRHHTMTKCSLPERVFGLVGRNLNVLIMRDIGRKVAGEKMGPISTKCIRPGRCLPAFCFCSWLSLSHECTFAFVGVIRSRGSGETCGSGDEQEKQEAE
jgi:hypothetical protein